MKYYITCETELGTFYWYGKYWGTLKKSAKIYDTNVIKESAEAAISVIGISFLKFSIIREA